MILLQVGVAAIVVVLVTAWFYTTVTMLAHPKNTSTRKKILHLIVGIVGGMIVGQVMFVNAIQPISRSVRVTQFEKYMKQQYKLIDSLKFSTERSLYEITFLINTNNFTFDTAEEIFQTTLNELQDAEFFSAISNSRTFNGYFEMSNVNIVFYEVHGQGERMYSFITPEADNYNKWKVSLSREREHINKEYYREISPKVGE